MLTLLALRHPHGPLLRQQPSLVNLPALIVRGRTLEFVALFVRLGRFNAGMPFRLDAALLAQLPGGSHVLRLVLHLRRLVIRPPLSIGRAFVRA